jgi:hypothetical protein
MLLKLRLEEWVELVRGDEVEGTLVSRKLALTPALSPR